MPDKNISSQVNPKIFHEILEEMGEAPKPQSPWAKVASEMSELIEQESPEVQAAYYEMDSGHR